MTKHVISIVSLLVVSIIALLSLLFDTREAGQLTSFGYIAAILTVTSFILGAAAEIHTIRDEAREEAEERAKHAEQQQHLCRIETEIKANAQPLLPIKMFYTIRHTTTPEAVERAFSGVPGFKSIKPGILQLVGTTRLGGTLGYNPIELTPSESQCEMQGDLLKKLIQSHSGFGESVIREPVSTTLEFFFAVDGVLPAEPTLVLEKTFTTGTPDEVIHLELFDNVIFQDSLVKKWTAQTKSSQSWSVANLRTSRLRVRLEFLGQLSPVSLHNLQLFFGPIDSMHGINFSEELLTNAVFKPNPTPLMHCENELASQFFSSYVLEYECILSESVMSECFVKVLS